MIRNKVVFLFICSICSLIICIPFLGSTQIVSPIWREQGQMLRFYDDTATIAARINSAALLQRVVPDSCISLSQQTLRQSYALQYTDGIIQSYANIAVAYLNNRLYSKAIYYYNRSIQYCLDIKRYRRYLSVLYNNIALVYQEQKLYDQAILYFHKAVQSTGQYASPITSAHVYNNMYSLYSFIGREKEALYYLDKAKPLQHSKDVTGRTYYMINRGSLYLDREEYNKAEKIFKEALVLAKRNNNRAMEGHALTNLAISYIKRGQSHRAQPLLLRALALKQYCSPDIPIIIYGALAAIRYDCRDFKAAERYMLQANSLAKNLPRKSDNILGRLLESTEKLSWFYDSIGKPDEALQYYRRYMHLKDSFYNADMMQNVSQIEIKYQIAEKDNELIQKQLLLARQEQRIGQKNFLITLSGLSATTIIIITTIMYGTNRRKKRLSAKENEVKQLRAMLQGEEKERGRLARELHDGIGGMLAAIKLNVGAIKKEFPETAHITKLDDIGQMLQDTGVEIRKTAHNLMPDILSRHNLQEALMLFCKQISSSSILAIDLRIQGSIGPLDKSTELLLYRMMQELVHNVTKHTRATHMEIQMAQYGNILSITAEDNGGGFNTAVQKEGAGLSNIRHRVSILQGIFSITSVPGKCTTVHMEFYSDKLQAVR